MSNRQRRCEWVASRAGRAAVATLSIAAALTGSGPLAATTAPAETPKSGAVGSTRAAGGEGYVPLSPVRILDTRPRPASAPSGPVPDSAIPLGQAEHRSVAVVGRAPVPQGARA